MLYRHLLNDQNFLHFTFIMLNIHNIDSLLYFIKSMDQSLLRFIKLLHSQNESFL